MLNEKDAKGGLVIYVSDSESWMDTDPDDTAWGRSRHNATSMMVAWQAFQKRNKGAKLVCIDLVPNTTRQAVGENVLNVGGFSDAVFDVIAAFVKSDGKAEQWVAQIEALSLTGQVE